ncbi:MAG: hypothetical protein GF398_13370 [Chitinivibrionales bacterium]|nr:hypothetical protein [Chitinivibrionales bacterium]
MILRYKTYDFTPAIGWSISRYETFDKCKRQYYYNYYGRYTTSVPIYKIKLLKALTSIPLEIGNVVHDVMEAFLKRLQKSDTDIDEERFFAFARHQAQEYFSKKSFIELYYRDLEIIDMEQVQHKIEKCLSNFLNSPTFNWLYMKALLNKENWMIEPDGYGETRLDGLKAYCKMDFLFPVEDDVYILDWKTGKRDTAKHGRQLIGYAAAAGHNFDIVFNRIFPKIVYLYPEFSEFEISLRNEDLVAFIGNAKEQTEEMYGYCSDKDKNVPLPIEAFPLSPSPVICSYCNYRELCFPKTNSPQPVI